MPPDPTDFDPAAHGWEPYTDDGFIGLVGPLWQKVEHGVPRYSFQAGAKHRNRRGVLQGGMLMTFADRSMGMTAWYANGEKPQATVQFGIHFLRAVQVGDFVEARCFVERRTRSLIFVRGTFFVGEEQVASASGVWKALHREG